MIAETGGNEQERPFQHGVKVLLVDDQPMIGEAVRRMLQTQEDIEFYYCQDPKQAVTMAVDIGPTVILQDLIMPDIDGLTLMKRIKKEDPSIPVVIITGFGSQVVDEAMQAGADGFIEKPFKIEDIKNILSKTL